MTAIAILCLGYAVVNRTDPDDDATRFGALIVSGMLAVVVTALGLA